MSQDAKPQRGGQGATQREARHDNQRDSRRETQREAWLRALRAKGDAGGKLGGKVAGLKSANNRNLKVMGPNKASGHKGGMGRQGSKRG